MREINIRKVSLIIFAAYVFFAVFKLDCTEKRNFHKYVREYFLVDFDQFMKFLGSQKLKNSKV